MSIDNICSLQTVELVKWVKVEGEFRFIVVSFYEHHGMLVWGQERATAAGSILVSPDGWRHQGYGSNTLGVGVTPQDLEELGALFLQHGKSEKH